MKFLKSNILSIVTMSLLFTVVMLGDASATVFGTAANKLAELFTNTKTIIFLIGGFGLVALAFQAIFGKIKWAWFAAFGLVVVAAAGAIVDYASGTTKGTSNFADTLGSVGGKD